MQFPRAGIRINKLHMGNPFHLNDEVCQKLKEYGCRKYQISLDGIQETFDNETSALSPLRPPQCEQPGDMERRPASRWR